MNLACVAYAKQAYTGLGIDKRSWIRHSRAKLSFERVSEQQSQARSFPALDLEAMDRDSSLPQYSIGKQGRRTQIAANVECIMKGLEILSPPIKS
ncbi:hypothetical protein V6N11_018354 [Hibiscus sabdariffa]|uniref:Uncharacterized protein n=1 Tax=Hibiscus sabdariffa TaxID=183260 RepID=A0ABR2T7L1_9ROSI